VKKLHMSEVLSRLKKDGFTLLSASWHGADKEYTFMCERCNYVFSRRYYNIYTNTSCPRCKTKKQYNKLNIEHWIQLGKAVGLTLISNTYKSARVPMKWRCNVCDYVFSNAGCNIKAGSGCPKCVRQISKNEETVREYLESKTGLTFPKVKPSFLVNPNTGKRLELDGYCKKLKMAFEYDGEQHFKPVKCWGGKNRFLKTKKLDLLKNKLCKNNNIRLLRINYKNIQEYKEIIDSFLDDL
jgi:rubrerythrin